MLTTADGADLHLVDTGPADAPVTVLFLHGWTLDGATWHRQLDALPALAPGTRLVSYDARGHGDSGLGGRRSATLERLGDDLAEVVRHVNPAGRLILVGHSLGGMTIMEYAHLHPGEFGQRVHGLVLVSTTAEGHAHTAYGLPAPLTTLVRMAETTSARVLAFGGHWRPHRVLQPALRPGLRWLLFGQVCDPADLRRTAATVARAPLCSIGGLRASVGAQRRLDTLAAIAPIPTTILVGDRDRLTPPPCARSIAAAVPGADLHVLPGAGHMLMFERPDEVTRAIAGAVAGVATRPAA
ncbi:alpha/beta fold hydrolase [Rhizomonospora bruguierae]|uniref:alpha/beta fold hydrolase n=1 Tax=Rhizomonospora bruguierae TaxID=1581705 RepID=UPI0020BE4136|nr:alpha/beta hydrolase [Micromonospora sp. NBRC 107566]